MIPENLIQRHDSKKFMTIEVRHSDTLASLRDEDNTFISSTSTISTRSGLMGLEPLQHLNNTRRIRRQESLTASTIVEKSHVDSYEQPQPVPGEKTAMVLPFEGRAVLQLEDEDITIKMLKAMHAQLERELQEKKERGERKKRMKQMIREEKEKEKRASLTKSKRRGSGDTEPYSREQEIRDLQLIQDKLKEQKRVEHEIAVQIRRENRNREQRVVRDDRRHVVPANELLHDSSISVLDRKHSVKLSGGEEAERLKASSERSTQRFASHPKRSPVSRAAPRPPARHLRPDDIEPIVLVSQKLAQMSMSPSKAPTVASSSADFAEMTRQDYIPSEEDTALCTFTDSYSSLDPRPFCSAVDSVKLARGEYISSEEDASFVGTFVSDSGSLFSEKEPWGEMAERGATRRASKRVNQPPSHTSKLSPTSADQKPALPNRAASFDDSFSLLSLENSQR